MDTGESKTANKGTRTSYTCASCHRQHEGSTGYAFVTICTCGNPMASLVADLGASYVIAQTPDAAESAAARGRGDKSLQATYRRWLAQPLPMKTRYSVYGVRAGV